MRTQVNEVGRVDRARSRWPRARKGDPARRAFDVGQGEGSFGPRVAEDPRSLVGGGKRVRTVQVELGSAITGVDLTFAASATARVTGKALNAAGIHSPAASCST